MFKKVLAGLMIVTLSFSMVGCSSKKEAVKEQKIVIWNAGIQTTDDSGKVKKEDLPINKAIAKFEAANPGCKVDVIDYSMDDLQKAFTAANLAKQGPDIVALWAGSPTNAYKDYLVDYNKYMNDNEKKIYDVSSLLHADNNSKEKLMGLVNGDPSTEVMYVNKEIFDKNGVKIPTNWEELQTASEQLKAKGVTPLMYGDKDGYTSTWLLSALLASKLGPDNIGKLTTGEEKMSGAAFQDSLKLMKDYIGKGYTNPDYLTLSDGDAVQNFIQGKAAMIVHGNWASRDFANLGDKVEVIKIPVPSSDPFAGDIPSQPNINVVVTNYSKNVDKAVEFAKQIASPEYIADSQKAFYSDPNTLKIADKINGFTAEGKNVTGFDSLITGDAATEFYKLVPTYIKGTLKLDDFTAKLDALNVPKK